MNGPENEQPREITVEWRTLFDGKTLRDGKRYIDQKSYTDFRTSGIGAQVGIFTSLYRFNVTISQSPSFAGDSWNPRYMRCTCNRVRRTGTGFPETNKLCCHVAALLYLWEQKHGPWTFLETQAEIELRLAEERRIAEQRRLQLLRRDEELRRKELKVKLYGRQAELHELLKDRITPNRYFDLDASTDQVFLPLYEAEMGKTLYQEEGTRLVDASVSHDRQGKQQLIVKTVIRDSLEPEKPFTTDVTLSEDRIVHIHCSCQDHFFMNYRDTSDTPLFCSHGMAAMYLICDYLRENDPGDATDQTARAFLHAMVEKSSTKEKEDVPEVTKEACVNILPVITINTGIPCLSFKIAGKETRYYQLKKLRNLTDAYLTEGTFPLGRTRSLDFSKQDFTQESRPWVEMIFQRISDSERMNSQLQSHSYYTPSLSVPSSDELTGAPLDRFYELALGSFCEYENAERRGVKQIFIGHSDLRISVRIDALKNRNGKLLGVEVNGDMPVIIRGVTQLYTLDDRALSRIDHEDAEVLRPFLQASDEDGRIHFRIGTPQLAEFYYRVVPIMECASFIDLKDNCHDEIAVFLPPEPEFLFRLDIEDGMITCIPEITYDGLVFRPLERALRKEGPDLTASRKIWARDATGDLSFEDSSSGELPGTNSASAELPGTAIRYRDLEQENRVAAAIREYFPGIDIPRCFYYAENTEENGYRLLQEGIPELNRYGEVLGTDAFRSIRLRPTPKFTMKVSIDCGMMDLSLISDDLPADELLNLLKSYRLKKKYYRLRSGEYYDLSESRELSELISLADEMGIDLSKMTEQGIRLPSYRALYLDKLLTERDQLQNSRNRSFRTMVREFQTIRNADFEVPDSMAHVLRPYQAYGYKWLRTLQGAGFGGILADEMGLGKTLQAIALIRSLHDEGLTAPVLVVCPASLVYNWQEEIARFAPELRCLPLTGTAAERQKLQETLTPFDPETSPEVCIISYDLLRIDVDLYRSMHFRAMFIDEAQYIKNTKAAMTKAVKIMTADFRVALTGTPIENRLSELWSIFDFLMPGFLFSERQFAERFEVPIIKYGDESAALRLRSMVSPFILRRLKTDVLKDLPEKMEEIRYARLDEEQRRLYDGQVTRMKGVLKDSWSTGEGKIRVLAELTRLRELCCDPSLILDGYTGGSAKREACLELVRSAIEGGHRMLIFSQFTSMLSLLEQDLAAQGIRFYKIVGSTPKEERIRLVHRFNEGDVPVFLISLKAGGTGLNLTGADVVIHYDPWWNQAAQNQATDRAHRIGQTKKVTVYKMIIKNTVEEKILALQDAKKGLANEILSGEGTSLFSLSAEELLELLR